MRYCSNPLLEVLVVGIVSVVILALFVPSHETGIQAARRISCANNLRQLYALGVSYSSQHQGDWPAAGEEGLWLSFTRTEPPLIAQDELEVLLCPVKGEPETGSCDYRGPRIPVRSLKKGDILSADKRGNHGADQGGHVLLLDGSVLEPGLHDAQWEDCDAKLYP
jgi:hypothetical protein